MNINSYFKIQCKNGECISPIFEISSLLSPETYNFHLTNVRTCIPDVMFTIAKLVTIAKRCLDMVRPKASFLQSQSVLLFHDISSPCITKRNKDIKQVLVITSWDGTVSEMRPLDTNSIPTQLAG